MKKFELTQISVIFIIIFPTVVPFSATSDVRAHSLSLYCGLELLLDSAKSLWEHYHTHPRLTTPTPICEMLSQQSCDQLLSTISQQTALYCSKLLQVHVEKILKNFSTCEHLKFS